MPNSLVRKRNPYLIPCNNLCIAHISVVVELVTFQETVQKEVVVEREVVVVAEEAAVP